MRLTAEQIAFFKHNGYVLLEAVMDAGLCARARDRLWASLPPGTHIRRDEPATHVGPFREPDTSADTQNLRDGYRWQVRSVGTEALLLDLVFSASLCEAAEDLLGHGTLRTPVVDGATMGRHGAAWPGGPIDPALDNEGVRGIYATLPYGNREREADRCHTDGHPFNLGMVGLIDDVPPDGGAFKVWPGSHRRLFPTFQMRYDQPRVPYYDHLPSYKGILHTPEYLAELEQLQADTDPVDCWGRAGDVVLWHHRTAHMAGHNHSNVIRQAVLYDFVRTDLDVRRMDPAAEDMWRDWSAAVQTSNGEFSDATARAQRLPPAQSPRR